MKTRLPHPQGRMHVLHTSLSAVLLLSLLLGGTVAPAAAMSPATVQTAPDQQIILEKSQVSGFSPHGKASYGEIITYTLHYEIPAGTFSAVVLSDVFSDPAYPVAYLPVSFDNRDSEGPIAIGSTPPTGHITPTVTNPTTKPNITWELGNITVPGGSTYIYEIRYHVRVTYDNNANAWRTAHSTGTVAWTGGNSGGTVLDVRLTVPDNMTFEKQQTLPDPPDTELDPGAHITWTMPTSNITTTYEGTAYDMLVTDTLPLGIAFDDCFGPVDCTQAGQNILWNLPALPVPGHEHFTITAHLPATNNVAHATLFNNAYFIRSSAPGSAPGERRWPVVQRTTQAYVRNIGIDKEQTSIELPNNNTHQAEAFEMVRITVTVTVPQGVVIYNPLVRILLEDGLDYINMVSPATNPITITDPVNQDSFRPGGYWTQLTWTDTNSITDTASGPVSFTYVLDARVNQEYTLQSNPQIHSNIPHNTLLRIVPIVRWTDSPTDPDPDPNDQYLRQRNDTTNATVSVQFIRPDLRYQSSSSGSYLQHTGVVEGDGTINFTLHVRQRNETPVHPPAYDVVVLNRLSPDLTFVSANPAPDNPSCPGGECTWTLSYPITTTEEHDFQITASLPPTIVAGMAFSSTTHAAYTTLEGDNPDEGRYVDVAPGNPPYTAQDIFSGGFAIAKASETTMGGADVRIGDIVTYTVYMTVNKGVVMYLPTFQDLLPRGFHYVDGSMSVSGGVISAAPVVTRTGNAQVQIDWGLETVDNTMSQTPAYVQVTYLAQLTGRDWDDNEVYASSAGDFQSHTTVQNRVNACWRLGPDQGYEQLCLGQPYRLATNYVSQPWLATNYVKTLNEATNEFEVGSIVHYYVNVQNGGWGPAYDIVLTDTLPAGVAINGPSWLTLNPEDPTVQIISEPISGTTGVVTWTLSQIVHGQAAQLHYNVQVLDTVIPGDPLVNRMRIANYSSQPGTDNEYDRYYKRWDNAPFQPDPIPAPASANPFYVRGLTVVKADDPHLVDPGQTLTYHIDFSNTSELYDAEYIRITDTYDIDTTFVSWNGNDAGIYLVRNDVGTHTIIWGLRRINHGDTKVYGIDMVCTVNEPMHQEDQLLTNRVWIDGVGDLAGVVSRVVDTNVRMPFLQMQQSAAPVTVYPDEDVVFTIDLTNIGQIPATGVVLQSAYDPNVTFVSAVPSPDAGTNNRWSVGPLDITGTYQVLVTVHVNKPFPSGVYNVTNQISAHSAETYETQGPSASAAISVPILELTVSATPSPTNPSDRITYRIDYVNTGMAATGAELTVELDQYADSYVGASPTPPDNGCAGGVCTWALGELIPGVEKSITLLVDADGTIPSNIKYLRATTSIESNEVGPNVVITDDPLANRNTFEIYLPVILKNR